MKNLPSIGDVKPMQKIETIEMLPDEEISIIHALVSKIIKAWDPDFTKVTAEERKRLEEMEIKNGIYFTEKDVFD